jgi:hypothetical protein
LTFEAFGASVSFRRDRRDVNFWALRVFIPSCSDLVRTATDEPAVEVFAIVDDDVTVRIDFVTTDLDPIL